MISRLPPLVFRLALLVAVAVSAALLIDYFRPLPAFCDVGSGCDKVRASGFGKVLGVPVPLVGLLAFSSIAMLSLSTHPAAARWTRVLTLVGGAGGLVLLSVQAFLLHVFCKLCVAVDIAAVVAAVAVLLSPRSPNTFTTSEARWLWPVATTLAVLLPGGWALLQPSPPVPPEIASLWIPGKINVVEFADFQCPFCRQLHPRMAELLREYDDRVNFVRLNVPLPMHSQAQTAAAAYCCAEDQGKAGAMADALFQAESLTLEACDRLAASVGLSMSDYRACVISATTQARIDDQDHRARSAGLAGLPTVWIGDHLLVGLQPIDALRAAFAEAARGNTTRLPTALLWAVFAAVLLGSGVIALYLRTAPGDPS